MSVYLEITGKYTVESANCVVEVKPRMHEERILPFFDFLYIIEGEWGIAEEENVNNMQSGDLLILQAGKRHYGIRPCSANIRYMYIHVHEELEKGRIGGATAREFHSLIHCRNNPRVKQLFEEIITVTGGEDELKAERQQMLFGLLLCELYRHQNDENKARLDIVEQAVNLVNTMPQVFFTNSEMAARFFVCERTLNNLFQKVHGKTFYAYQMDRKLEMIHQYLQLYPDTKLEIVAKNFGFCDEFHLGKAYKKKYRISPKRHARGKGWKEA